MRVAGFGAFVVGVIAASCFAARAVPPTATGADGRATAGDRLVAWWSAAGVPFTGGLALALVGGLLARRRPERTESSKKEPEDRARSPDEIADRIASELSALPLDDVAANAKAIHDDLDKILEEGVPEFLDHREALVESLGLARFAEMIGQFAAVERNVGRAWSALVDDVHAEVPECIERATTALTEVRALLRGESG